MRTTCLGVVPYDNRRFVCACCVVLFCDAWARDEFPHATSTASAATSTATNLACLIPVSSLEDDPAPDVPTWHLDVNLLALELTRVPEDPELICGLQDVRAVDDDANLVRD